MLKCITVDSNAISLKQINEYISSIPFLELLGSFQHPFEAVGFLNKTNVDLLFIEAELPVMTGIQLINSLTFRPMLVIISASEKYAYSAFQLNAIDYVLKPVSFESIVRAANKAYKYHNIKTADATDNIAGRQENIYDYIFVKSDYKIIRIKLNDILLIEGLKDYVKIHTSDKSVLSLLSLKSLETNLPSALFMRVHRSYIIALNKIDSIEKSRIKIDKYYIPVSESYKDVFFRRIQLLNV
jgi:DNA-binding LytR/AlgR family response regulator